MHQKFMHQKEEKANKKEKLIFFAYLSGFLILALSIALLQPLADTPPLFGNPPDEHARFLIPQYIYEHGKIPTGWEEEIRIPGYGFSYGLYNVFPYIVQGYVMRLVGIFTDSPQILLCAARMVNVLFGVGMAVVVYLIGRRVFADRRFRWLFCFAVMYLPQSLFMHTYVNTDSCCLLSTAMMVYALVCSYQEGFTRRNCLWLSGGIILCALSYYNAYGYILSSILLFLAYFLKREDGKWRYDWRQMLRKGIFISVIVLLGIGWWFIRSFLLNDGDILGLATRKKMEEMYGMAGINPEAMLSYQEKGVSLWQMLKERYTLNGAFCSFVAAFGSMSIYSSIWLYRLYKLFFGAGAAGQLLGMASRIGKREQKNWNGRKLFFHLNMLFCMLMPGILMIYYAYTMDYQHQGRYLLPAVVPLMYYVVRGIEKLSRLRLGKWHIPDVLINIGLVFCFLLIIGGTLDMVYGRALPVYLEIGMVLE